MAALRPPATGGTENVPVVLVVEDEPVLRASMVRGLARLPGIEVVDGATLREAERLIEAYRPALIVSDLSLPDGTGETLIGVLDGLHLRVPIIFVTAYLGEFQSRIPRRGDIEIHEKPVPLERLRALVERWVRPGAGTAVRGESPLDDAPFSLVDYLQIACVGAHSVTLVLETRGRQLGSLDVQKGVLWSAVDEQGRGEAAFARLFALDAARGPDTRTRCRAHRGAPGPREISTHWQALLLQVACALDEERLDLVDLDAPEALGPDEFDSLPTLDPGSAVATLDVEAEPPTPRAPLRTPAPLARAATPRPAAPEPEAPEVRVLREPTPRPTSSPLAPRSTPEPVEPEPPSRPEDVRFAWHFEAGVDALLSREYARAFDCFQQAALLHPDDPHVRANLNRLRALGFGEPETGR